eukprot:9694382-Alexandrium_andersonii.AAC.1
MYDSSQEATSPPRAKLDGIMLHIIGTCGQVLCSSSSRLFFTSAPARRRNPMEEQMRSYRHDT